MWLCISDSIACLSSVKRNPQRVQHEALRYEWQSKAGEAKALVSSGESMTVSKEYSGCQRPVCLLI